MDVSNPLYRHSRVISYAPAKTESVPIGVELWQFVHTLRRQSRLVTLIAILVVGGVFLGSNFLPEKYTSQAILVVDESESHLLGVESALSAGATLINRVDTEVQVLKSPEVLLRTIKRLELWKDGEFGLTPPFYRRLVSSWLGAKLTPVSADSIDDLTVEQKARLVAGLLNSIDVSREGFTSVISIKATSRSAEKAAAIADTLADSYFDLQIETRSKSAHRAAEFLRARVNELANEISEGSRRLNEFAKKHKKEFLTPEALVASHQLRSGVKSFEEGQNVPWGAEPPPPQSSIAVDLYRLQRDVETSRKLYDSYVVRLGEVQQQASLAMPNSRLMSSAMAPHRPSFPPKRLLLAVALVVGLAFGATGALLREHLLGGFTSPDQVSALTHFPVTAVLPLYTEEDPQDCIIRAPFSAFAETIRRMRLGIENVLEGKRPSVILVTSTEPNEGKTTLAIALARSMAIAQKRTLLIDGDLRQSSVSRLMKIASANTLVDLLTSQSTDSDLESALTIEKESGLYVLSANGRGKQHASDVLLASNDFRNLIEAAKAKFDMIIIDSPPIGYVVDAGIIRRECDAVVYIIRHAMSAQRNVLAGLREIMGGPRPPLPAIVMNGGREILSGHYYRSGPNGSYYHNS